MNRPTGLFVGLVTLDVIQRVERPPGANEKVVALRADLAAGGPATGAALAFAAAGGRSLLLTSVGDGPVADLVREDLAQHDVEVVEAAGGPAPSISSVVVIDTTGERSVVSRNAEGVEVAPPTRLEGDVATADVVLLDGHHPQLALEAARAARARGLPVVLDAGSWKPVVADLLPFTSAVVCSTSFRFPGDVPPTAALLEQGPTFVAITDGPHPVRWFAPQRSGSVSAPDVAVRDTLGAGDAFHGAFAHALATEGDPEAAIHRAVEVASIRVTHVGPRTWLSDPRVRLAAPARGDAR